MDLARLENKLLFCFDAEIEKKLNEFNASFNVQKAVSALGAVEQTGKEGEDEACRFLIDKGHTILERNWRSGHLEIDLITEAADGIHFVEVKSRKTGEDILPEESIGRNIRMQESTTCTTNSE